MIDPTRELHDLGQRLWLDNISRPLLRDGELQRYINDYAISGSTSHPTLFAQAIRTDAHDVSMRVRDAAGLAGEGLFLERALEDLTRATDLFRPIFEASGGVDG